MGIENSNDGLRFRQEYVEKGPKNLAIFSIEIINASSVEEDSIFGVPEFLLKLCRTPIGRPRLLPLRSRLSIHDHHHKNTLDI